MPSPSNVNTSSICRIKRRHGLGNLICLLPVLDRLYREGRDVTVVTRPEWCHAFSILRPEYYWISDSNEKLLDLDEMTLSQHPHEHRSDEFGHLIGIGTPFASPRVKVPEVWSRPFEKLSGSVVFAPEGGHPSRTWPIEKARQLMQSLEQSQPLVLAGVDPSEPIPCNTDLRGQLEVHDLFGLLSVAQVVITMDSAVMHIAAALGTPTVAVFGGIHPEYRIRQDQPVVTLQSAMDCCPCNKQEICQDRFTCIQEIAVEDVIRSIPIARKTKKRISIRIQTRSKMAS